MERLIIDVREPFEFRQGHVEGAKNVPLSQIQRNPASALGASKDAEIIVYCNSGNRSAQAAHHLKQAGFRNVKNGINKSVVEQYLS